MKTSAVLRQIKVGDWLTRYQTFYEALVIETGDISMYRDGYLYRQNTHTHL